MKIGTLEILLIVALFLSACSFTSTTTPTPFGRALFALMVQEPDEYPPGHVCVTPAQVKGPTTHACDCQRKCIPSEDSDGNQTIAVQEDPQCKQYCHPKSCSCPMKDCP